MSESPQRPGPPSPPPPPPGGPEADDASAALAAPDLAPASDPGTASTASDPGTASTAPDAAQDTRGAVARTLSRLTLRSRMVLLTVALLVLGLAVSTLAATTLLRDNLIGRVDQQLRTTAQALDGMRTDGISAYFGSSDGPLPSDYYFRTQTAAGAVGPALVQERTSQRWGTPDLPVLPEEQVTERQGVPFTVSGATAPSGSEHAPSWRVLALSTSDRDGNYNGVLMVALPLGDIERTTWELTKILGATCLTIAVIGGALGYLAVRRSLRPLRTIETTARAIAAGDLGQRIPPMPTTTEVGSLAASLNVMLGRIQHAFDVQAASESRMRRFASDASHELRTPLVTIRGYAELYRMGAMRTPEQVAEAMGRIEGSAVQMGTLVEDLLTLARLDERRAQHTTRVDLGALARDARSDLVAMDPSRTVDLVDLAGATPADASSPSGTIVCGDEARLRQILTNLVGNVATHTPAGSPVEIAVGGEGPNVLVEVRDHGPGIPAEHRKRVFERFHRVDASRTSASGGSGLGMAIVHDLVTAHHGDVAALETPGGGTTIRIRLPRADDYDDGSA
ncbi:MAG: sensor histidine kinase [Cellulomonadaceae bacterium]